MMLGQPETEAEWAAEQAQMERRSAAREANLARAVAAYRATIPFHDRESSARDASIQVARKFKLGRGGAEYVRRLAEQEPPDA